MRVHGLDRRARERRVQSVKSQAPAAACYLHAWPCPILHATINTSPTTATLARAAPHRTVAMTPGHVNRPHIDGDDDGEEDRAAAADVANRCTAGGQCSPCASRSIVRYAGDKNVTRYGVAPRCAITTGVIRSPHRHAGADVSAVAEAAARVSRCIIHLSRAVCGQAWRVLRLVAVLVVVSSSWVIQRPGESVSSKTSQTKGVFLREH